MKSPIASAAPGTLAIFLLLSLVVGGGQETIADDHQPNHPKGLHVIRLIAAASRVPIANAKVTVELDNPAKSKWEGHTDSKGVFTFTCDFPNGAVKAHTTVEAPGFWSLVDSFPLVEERVLQLKKVD